MLIYRFEKAYAKAQDKIGELESLVSYYEKFKEGNNKLLAELKRRKQVEDKIDKNVQEYRKSLMLKHNNEVQLRNKFNHKALKYLPSCFHPLLTQYPTKYEIYPTENKSLLHELGEELFSNEPQEITQSTIFGPSGKPHHQRKPTF